MTTSRPGLRVQILVALASVMLVAYVPLFFAVVQMTRATALAARESAARALGQAIAKSVQEQDVAPGHRDERLRAFTTGQGVVAIVTFDKGGSRLTSVGSQADADAIVAPQDVARESLKRTRTSFGARAVDVAFPEPYGAVVIRASVDEDAARASGTARGIALYMLLFALALLVFAYIALTRAIVRPVEQLARAADRVATGARAFDKPRAAPRELSELGESLAAMAQKLRDEQQALRAKIEELTRTTTRLAKTRAALGETREQLVGSEHMASVGKLAAGVAHEIGNPIAAIMGLHDLIESGALEPGERDDFLARMRKETERIHGVVRDLLDYARPDSARGTHVDARANVLDVVRDTLALVKPQKEWRDVDADVRISQDLIVAISAQRLTQVLLNILLNAGAALADSEDARVTIGAELVPEEGTSSGRQLVRIVVEDNGPGIAQEVRERLFDPFVTTKDVGAGTGLGLSVCKGIVSAASGSIALDPSYEGGARFIIELPVAGNARAALPEP